MKRTVQMAKAGTPSASQRSKFKGFRGVGLPDPITGKRREWRADGPVQPRHPVRAAKRAAALERAIQAELHKASPELQNILRRSA